jgi:hypothetical protein
MDTYDTQLRGIIEDITLGVEKCSLSDIEVSFAGSVEGASGDRTFRLEHDSAVARAHFSGARCLPRELTFVFEGAGRVVDGTSFDAEPEFHDLEITVDVTPSNEARIEVSGAFETAETDRIELTSVERIEWSEGCPRGGILNIETVEMVARLSFRPDGTALVDLDGDGEVDMEHASCADTAASKVRM